MDKVLNHRWFVPIALTFGSVEWPFLVWYTCFAN